MEEASCRRAKLGGWCQASGALSGISNQRKWRNWHRVAEMKKSSGISWHRSGIEAENSSAKNVAAWRVAPRKRASMAAKI